MSQPPRPPAPGQGQPPMGRSRGRAAPPQPPPGGPRPPMPQSMRPGQSTQPPSMMPPGRGGQIMAGPPQGQAPPGRMTSRPGPTAPPAAPPGRARGAGFPAPSGPEAASLASSMSGLSLQSTSSVSTSNAGSGTGSAITSRTGTQGGSGGASTADVASGSGVLLGVGRGSNVTARGGAGRPQSYILNTRPATAVSKQGAGGTPFKCVTNFFKIDRRPGWTLLQYRVDFSPEEDETKLRKELLNQHRPSISNGNFLFDGTMLFCITRYEQPLKLTVQSGGKNINITIRLVGEVQPTDYMYIQLMNILLRTCMQKMNLTLLGRNYFDPENKQQLKQFKIECWPGYVTSIRQHEQNLLMNVETATKILRLDTALDQMRELQRSIKDLAQLKSAVARLLIGNIVITRYNNKTYRIDDIDWECNPNTTFETGGKRIAFAEYFATKYKVKVTDLKQPMLVSNPTKQMQRRGMTTPIRLVPELCSMTGLSDDQRADFKLMKSIAGVSLAAPPQRIESLQRFSSRLQGIQEIGAELLKWDMKFHPQLQEFQARTLAPETIIAGRNQTGSYKTENADWGRMLGKLALFGPVKCPHMAVIYCKRDEPNVQEFVKSLVAYSNSIGFQMGTLDKFPIDQNRTPNYLAALEAAGKKGTINMMLVIIPNNKGDVYAAVKKQCLLKAPVPSQCVTATVLNKWVPKGIQSVASKVAIQMACKLGGEPWAVAFPPSAGGMMVMGYDTWHDASQKGRSVGAVVTTINDSLTRYYSMVTFHQNNEENVTQIGNCLKKSLQKYYSCNGKFPVRLIVYRDGVGDGQIAQVKNDEVASIRKVMAELKCAAKLAYVIVSKRINSRFFKEERPRQYVNPPSGSVFDDVITLPERYDFFLVSQSVRQGTVNPTSYNVIEDESGWPPKVIQLLTYKLTHLYYNWPGTVRVPMVCQYAHKLAYLVGQSVHATPHENLADLLYYL